MPSKCNSTAPEVVTAFLEAQRLRHVADEFRRSNEESFKFLSKARQCADTDGLLKIDMHKELCAAGSGDSHKERTMQVRALAEEANDGRVRTILLSLAESYDSLTE